MSDTSRISAGGKIVGVTGGNVDPHSDDVVWLSVISSAMGKQGYVSGQQANTLTAERGAAPAAVLLDPIGEAGHMFSAKTTPHMYVIDTQGVLRYNGAIDSIKSANPADIDKAEPYFQQAMDAVLKGEEVASKMTIPYGCSVKSAGQEPGSGAAIPISFWSEPLPGSGSGKEPEHH